MSGEAEEQEQWPGASLQHATIVRVKGLPPVALDPERWTSLQEFLAAWNSNTRAAWEQVRKGSKP